MPPENNNWFVNQQPWAQPPQKDQLQEAMEEHARQREEQKLADQRTQKINNYRSYLYSQPNGFFNYVGLSDDEIEQLMNQVSYDPTQPSLIQTREKSALDKGVERRIAQDRQDARNVAIANNDFFLRQFDIDPDWAEQHPEHMKEITNQNAMRLPIALTTGASMFSAPIAYATDGVFLTGAVDDMYKNGFTPSNMFMASLPFFHLSTGAFKQLPNLRFNKGKLQTNVEVPQSSRTFPEKYSEASSYYDFTPFSREEIPAAYISGLEESNLYPGVYQAQLDKDSRIMQNINSYYETMVENSKKNYGIELPNKLNQQDLLYIDPDRNIDFSNYMGSDKGMYIPDENLSLVRIHVSPEGKLYAVGRNGIIDLEGTTVHEFLSHQTDKYMTPEVIQKYEDILKELGIEPTSQPSVPGNWTELRATLKQIDYIAKQKGINLGTASDSEIQDLLKLLQNNYGEEYTEAISRTNNWNGFRKGFTLPAVTGILGITSMMNNYKSGGKLIPRKRFIK